MKIKKIIIFLLILFISQSLISCTPKEHVHTWEDATCYAPKTCSTCHETEGTSLGHDYGPWEITIPATCTKDGEQMKTCKRCQITETEVIPCSGHQWDNSNPQRCTICELVKGSELIPVGEPTYDDLITSLNNLIPDEVNKNLQFPNRIGNSSSRLEWSTSNPSVISNKGILNKADTDQKVNIHAEIIFTNVTFTFNKEVVVKALELKPIVGKKLVIGYLYDSGSVNVSDSDLEKVDYINYSFGNISNKKVSVNNMPNLTKVLSYRNNGVRIGLALGGWGGEGFSEAVRTKESRQIFIDSIMNIIKTYHFDGLDIDWEYPTSSVAGIISDPSDRDNLTSFCQEMKQAMQAYRSDLLLTIAIAPSNQFYDLKALSNYIDLFNVMTYDFAMGTTANHLTNLYANSGSSADNSIRIVSQYVPMNKIVIGAAFYGRMGIFASDKNTFIGAQLSTSLSQSALSYTKIKQTYIDGYHWEEQFDENAKAAYMIKGYTFITYDSRRSIACKAQYVIDNDLAGIMFWDLTQDTTGDLLTSINDTLFKEK